MFGNLQLAEHALIDLTLLLMHILPHKEFKFMEIVLKLQ